MKNSREEVRMKKTLVILLLSLFPAVSAWADEKEHELSPVVVSDTKDTADDEAEPPYSRFALPESAEATEQIFTRKDIEAMRPRDVFDLIETSLGMTITRQGARVHNFTKSRGDEVSIILDGVYLSTTEAQRALGDIPVSMIESVKLIRDATVLTLGPLAKFGSAGAGSPNQGFIVITTRRGGHNETELKGSYASYNTVNAGIFHGNSFLDDKLKLGLGYTKSRSSGKTNWNNGYDSDSFYANIGYSTKHLESGLSLFVNRASRDVQRHVGNSLESTNYPKSGPTPAGLLDQHIWRYDPINALVFSYNAALKWNEDQTTSLTYGFSRVKGEQFADTLTSKAAAKQFKDRVHEINLFHTIASEKNTFKVGGQGIFWYQLSEGKTTPRQEESYGGYVYDEYRPTSRLSFDGAFRTDAKRVVKGGDKYRDDGGTVALSDNQWTDQAYAVSVGSSYKLTPILTVLARFSYNNTPTPDTLTTEDNVKLAAEERFKYEAGVEARLHRTFNVSVTGFYYDIENAKVSAGTISVPSSLDPTTTESVTVYKAGNVRRYGIEVGMNGTLLESPVYGTFGYTLGYTWFCASNLDSDKDSPENKVSARLNYRNGDYDANLTILRVDPYSSYGVIVGDFTTVNLNLGKSFRFNDMLARVSVFGQNLTDEQFATNNKGYPVKASWGSFLDVGATFGVEVSLKF
jgi:outer membrane cobalamin receptor